MKRINIATGSYEVDSGDPPGFRAAMLRLGPQLGAERTGISVYDLPPGEALCPYHYEHGEEEWVLVLSGTPSVRHPEGTDELQPFDAVFFPRGPAGAHQLRNDSAQTARVLMFSDVVVPTATTYPDSDKIGIWTGNRDEDVMVRRSTGVDYWDGEVSPR
jgi:uncharacterized cupin superfamily protein